jgi:uncharacterized protein (TIGR02266 family)
MTDTRKDKRAPLSLKVRFKSATVDEFIEQYSKDISKGGIFIKSKSPMAIGTLLKFEFQLKDESKLIQGVGRVVWKREAEGATEADPSGMGIKFIKMDPESKALVDQIVAGRGDAPGAFEAGGGKDDADEGAAAAPAAAEAPKRPVRSAKATMQFFPSTTPQSELPRPEDRTQVRHASEFLASALSSAGVDEATTGEAESKAEEARKRSEEIEREREEQQRKAREEAEAKLRAEKDRQEREAREKAEAEEKAKAAEREAEEKAAREAEEKKAAAAKKAEEKKADEAKPAAKPAAKEEKKDEKKPAAAAAAAAAPAKKPEAKPATPAPAPAQQPSNMMLPIAAVVGVAALVGLWFVFGGGGSSGGSSTDLPPPPPSSAPEPPPSAAAEPETPPPSEVVPDEVPPPPETEVVEAPPAVTHDVEFASTPAGATIVVDGEERGAAPQTIALAEGEHAIEARLAGYHTATSTVTSAEGVRPVRLTLTALPYTINVTTTPPGARVRIGARTVTAPGHTDVPRPTAALTATATLAGYLDGTATIAPTAFVQGEDAMVAEVNITLNPRPAAPPPTTTAPRPPRTTTTSGGATGAPHEETPTGTETPPPPPPPPPPHEETPPPQPHTEAAPHEEAHTAPPPPAGEAPPENPF